MYLLSSCLLFCYFGVELISMCLFFFLFFFDLSLHLIICLYGLHIAYAKSPLRYRH